MKSKTTRKVANRRKFLRQALLGAAGGVMIAPLATAANAPSGKAKRKGVSPANAAAADAGYTPGIVVEAGSKIIFVSGQGPRDMNANLETQMRQTLEAIGEVLKGAGASMADIVILRSYFVDIARGLPAYRRVRRDYLTRPYPASTAVGVTALAVPELKVEIEAVAVI